MGHLLQRFRRIDLEIFIGILVLSAIAAGLPEVFDPDYPYPTSLYYVFTSIAQALGPMILLGIGLLLLAKRSSTGGVSPLRTERIVVGLILKTISFLLALILLPFAEPLYQVHGLRQGVIAFLIMMSLWGVVTTVVPLLSGISREDSDEEHRA